MIEREVTEGGREVMEGRRGRKGEGVEKGGESRRGRGMGEREGREEFNAKLK